ncbi:MAG: hypothetical protein LBN29_12580 [Mediterranea sp.]|jgi:hypothetical protein|nr:hypothetical protein [Mediterranea sp.]
MKYILTFILICSSLLWACGSSNDTPGGQAATATLDVSRTDVKLSNLEGSYTIGITAGGGWEAQVTSGQEWLSLQHNSGNGNADLRLLFAGNPEMGTRTGHIVVTLTSASTTLQKEVTVEQLGSDPAILLEYSTSTLPYTGADLSCRVVANTTYEVLIADAYSDWITQAATTRMTTDELTFNIAPNVTAQRQGEVTFRATDTDFTLTTKLTLTQEGVKNTLALSGQDEYIIPHRLTNGLVIPITQQEPIAYTIESPPSWVSLDTDASTDAAVALNVEENTDFLPRTATVTIKNSVSQVSFQLFQYGRPDTSIGDDPSAAQLLAFPGAEGGGRFTTGGRGGELYRVTTLEDYARNETPIDGSLRYGVEKSASPRTIVFDVSGIIELKRALFLADHPNVSIIGQTAPGDGITLKNYNFSFNLSQDSKEMNAIIRFLRVRPGDKYADYAEDGIGGRYFTNAIIDHVTASWSVDETLSFYGCQNFTAQWCMATESLNISNHDKGAHGYGSMMSGDNATFHHILLAHHSSRCPRISDLPEPGTEGAGEHIGYFDVRNNVYYNWSEAGFGSYGGKYGTFNLTDCYYKAGPATGTGSMAWRVLSSDPTARAYIEGNYMTASAEVTADNWTNGVWSQFWRDLHPTEAEMLAMRMSSPQPFAKVTAHTAQQAYDRVLEYAGASLRRDAIDTRVVNEVRTGTTTYQGSLDTSPKPGIIDTVTDTEGYPAVKSLEPWPDTDGDGIPDIWEQAYRMNPNDPADAAQVSTTVDPNGRYSNLEVYFHNLVQHIVYYQNQGGQLIEKN